VFDFEIMPPRSSILRSRRPVRWAGGSTRREARPRRRLHGRLPPYTDTPIPADVKDLRIGASKCRVRRGAWLQWLPCGQCRRCWALAQSWGCQSSGIPH
jgi:hypothetical protein